MVWGRCGLSRAAAGGEATLQRGLGEGEGQLVVACGCGDGDVGDVEHLDAVLVAVGGVAHVALGRSEGDAVAGGGAVEEGEVAGGLGLGDVEEVLGGEGRGLDHHGAGGFAVGDEHFLSAAHQLAVDGAVGCVEGYGLEATRVSEELERRGVALLEDEGAGLVAVGDSGGGSVGGGVVNARHGEVEGRDLADGGIHGERATAAGGFVEDAVVVEVDGGAGERGTDEGVGDARSCDDGFAHAARLQDAAEARSGASGAGAGQLDLEGDADAAVGEQAGAVAEVGANQVAANQIGFDRGDVEVTDVQRVGAGRRAVSAVGGLLLDQDQPLAGKCHEYLGGWPSRPGYAALSLWGVSCNA
mgnify:CR=1 FL=1